MCRDFFCKSNSFRKDYLWTKNKLQIFIYFFVCFCFIPFLFTSFVESCVKLAEKSHNVIKDGRYYTQEQLVSWLDATSVDEVV